MDQVADSRFIHCPVCGGKTRTKVNSNTILINFPLYCCRCRRVTQIDVFQMKLRVSDEPAASSAEPAF